MQLSGIAYMGGGRAGENLPLSVASSLHSGRQGLRPVFKAAEGRKQQKRRQSLRLARAGTFT